MSSFRTRVRENSRKGILLVVAFGSYLLFMKGIIPLAAVLACVALVGLVYVAGTVFSIQDTYGSLQVYLKHKSRGTLIDKVKLATAAAVLIALTVVPLSLVGVVDEELATGALAAVVSGVIIWMVFNMVESYGQLPSVRYYEDE